MCIGCAFYKSDLLLYLLALFKKLGDVHLPFWHVIILLKSNRHKLKKETI